MGGGLNAFIHGRKGTFGRGDFFVGFVRFLDRGAAGQPEHDGKNNERDPVAKEESAAPLRGSFGIVLAHALDPADEESV